MFPPAVPAGSPISNIFCWFHWLSVFFTLVGCWSRKGGWSDAGEIGKRGHLRQNWKPGCRGAKSRYCNRSREIVVRHDMGQTWSNHTIPFPSLSIPFHSYVGSLMEGRHSLHAGRIGFQGSRINWSSPEPFEESRENKCQNGTCIAQAK